MPRKSTLTNRMMALALAFGALATSIFFFQTDDNDLVMSGYETPAADIGAGS